MKDYSDSVSVENVVATSDVGTELDLDQLADDLSGAQFDPDNFPAVVYRNSDPKSTTLIFRSGKVVCTGVKGIGFAHDALETAFEALEGLGIPVNGPPEVSIANVVSSANLDTNLNLNAIAIGLGLERTEYEPEQFPGLVYRMEEPSLVLLLFASGHLIITGGNDTEEVPTAIHNLTSELDNLGLAV